MSQNNHKLVLIAEDDESLRKVISERLAEEKIGSIFAGTGQEALNKVKSGKPNLVLLDIMLPGGMNGFDVLEQLKSDETTKLIPVMVLTNLDTEQKTALDIGAIDYIVKPNISLEEVILKIKNHLQ